MRSFGACAVGRLFDASLQQYTCCVRVRANQFPPTSDTPRDAALKFLMAGTFLKMRFLRLPRTYDTHTRSSAQGALDDISLPLSLSLCLSPSSRAALCPCHFCLSDLRYSGPFDSGENTLDSSCHTIYFLLELFCIFFRHPNSVLISHGGSSSFNVGSGERNIWLEASMSAGTTRVPWSSRNVAAYLVGKEAILL